MSAVILSGQLYERIVKEVICRHPGIAARGLEQILDEGFETGQA